MDDLALVLAPETTEAPRAGALVASCLDGLVSPHTRRNYAKALVELSALGADRREPFSRALFMANRAELLGRGLCASTINVRLSAVRKLIDEARCNGVLGTAEAADLADVPNVPQKGNRMGNWLTREQSRELLAIPDRDRLKGKRDA